MDLLIISNNPERPSFRQRIALYLDILRANNINCQVAKLPATPLARFLLFKRTADFDGVLLHKKSLNILDALFLRRYARKIIYDFDDAIMFNDEAPDKPSYKRQQAFQRTVKIADMVTTVNSYLAEHTKKFNNNVEVLPTGINIARYETTPPQKEDDKTRLVWIGSKSTLKYLAEIKPALEEIGSGFDNVVLRIICDNFFDLQNMQVEKHRWSLDKEVEDLATSHIGLSPLPDNPFARGKCVLFKTLQYAATSLPTIASPVGVKTGYVRAGLASLFATNRQQWVEKITQLIEQPDLRSQMGQTARQVVQDFDVTVIGQKLSDLVTECIVPKPVSITIGLESKTKTDDPTVSICIPTYNRKKYLRETIDSILAQTYKDYEIVIVDDGSIDGTGDMVKQLGIPVVYHWQENQGDAAARNKLIELARGKYISFIDSDDLLLPDAIEKMVTVIEGEKDDVIVYGSYLRIDHKGNIYGKCKRKLYSGNITKQLFKTILVHACGSMFPRHLLEKAPAFDTSLEVCSDYDLWLQLSMKCRFIALPAPTFKRRRHSTNLSYTSYQNCLTEFEVLKRFYHEKGGSKVIPRRIARKVFIKECCRAGKCAINEGLHDQALQILGQSLRKYPNFKSLIYWTKAAVAKQLTSS